MFQYGLLAGIFPKEDCLFTVPRPCSVVIYTVPKAMVMMQTISSLEKDIAGLKKEIGERDETIGDKEKRIYDLKKKNQVSCCSHVPGWHALHSVAAVSCTASACPALPSSALPCPALP